jgi:hypothetical protein
MAYGDIDPTIDPCPSGQKMDKYGNCIPEGTGEYAGYDWTESNVMEDFDYVTGGDFNLAEFLESEFGIVDPEKWLGLFADYDPTEEAFAEEGYDIKMYDVGESYRIGKKAAEGQYLLGTDIAQTQRTSGLAEVGSQGRRAIGDIFSKEAQQYAAGGAAGMGGAAFGQARRETFSEAGRKSKELFTGWEQRMEELGFAKDIRMDELELAKTTGTETAELALKTGIYEEREEYMKDIVAQAEELGGHGAEVRPDYVPGRSGRRQTGVTYEIRTNPDTGESARISIPTYECWDGYGDFYECDAAGARI